jgi:hypothetical protein
VISIELFLGCLEVIFRWNHERFTQGVDVLKFKGTGERTARIETGGLTFFGSLDRADIEPRDGGQLLL